MEVIGWLHLSLKVRWPPVRHDPADVHWLPHHSPLSFPSLASIISAYVFRVPYVLDRCTVHRQQ